MAAASPSIGSRFSSAIRSFVGDTTASTTAKDGQRLLMYDNSDDDDDDDEQQHRDSDKTVRCVFICFFVHVC